ncbi:TetR/AcrR family transcriptional regulator [Acutalibacter caecimuris]|uniref:TetR/AcrR family transcriptional regulator n=1 Tax=Acutalibacter caecimuris TaxID=3093657 RepID=UPI002AC8D0F0|nr:TetR/AcrR family transcriptional regulator [Acutalibacter sp. M00118]
MNKPNNKRSRDTDDAIIRAAFAIMVDKNKPVSKITVREICEMAEINRSTFYAHYTDVYDLFEKVERQIAQMCADTILTHIQSGGIQAAIEGVFAFVLGYREFYQVYKETNRLPYLVEILASPFKNQVDRILAKDLGYGIPGEMAYHFDFFTAGMGSMLERWLDTGCKETPHQLFEILVREYGPHSLLRTWVEQ